MFRLTIRREMPASIQFRTEEHRSSRNPKYCANLIVGTPGCHEIVSAKFEVKAEFDAYLAAIVKFKNEYQRAAYQTDKYDELVEMFNDIFCATGTLSKSAVKPSKPSELSRIYEISIYKDVDGKKYGASL